VRQRVQTVQRVNFKLVLGNPVAEVVQGANIKIKQAKRHVNFVVRVHTTTTMDKQLKVLVRIVQLVDILALVLHHVRIVQLVHILALVLHHVRIVQLVHIHRQVLKRVYIVTVDNTQEKDHRRVQIA
jgi:hypothetical protein